MIAEASTIITFNDSYCTINYESDKKIKVGIIYDGEITYYDYKSNYSLNYAFNKGDGEYIVCVYEQICGNKYKLIEKEKMIIKLTETPMAPYLISTYDVNFNENGILSKIATELCQESINDWERVFIIKNYVNQRISYDYDFAKQIEDKIISNYIPMPLRTWKTKKGICYDSASLFAAMCRSQGIPCAIQKGYINDVYHAWNEVYIDGEWYSIDVNK